MVTIFMGISISAVFAAACCANGFGASHIWSSCEFMLVPHETSLKNNSASESRPVLSWLGRTRYPCRLHCLYFAHAKHMTDHSSDANKYPTKQQLSI